jgi:hypothetical protein
MDAEMPSRANPVGRVELATIAGPVDILIWKCELG